MEQAPSSSRTTTTRGGADHTQISGGLASSHRDSLGRDRTSGDGLCTVQDQGGAPLNWWGAAHGSLALCSPPPNWRGYVALCSSQAQHLGRPLFQRKGRDAKRCGED